MGLSSGFTPLSSQSIKLEIQSFARIVYRGTPNKKTKKKKKAFATVQTEVCVAPLFPLRMMEKTLGFFW